MDIATCPEAGAAEPCIRIQERGVPWVGTMKKWGLVCGKLVGKKGCDERCRHQEAEVWGTTEQGHGGFCQGFERMGVWWGSRTAHDTPLGTAVE